MGDTGWSVEVEAAANYENISFPHCSNLGFRQCSRPPISGKGITSSMLLVELVSWHEVRFQP